jgi:hypothetical protein
MDEKRPRNSDAVGYGQPPKASQFKKGESGNPGGRPPKTHDRESIAVRVLGEVQRLSGQPKGTRRRFATLELIVMALKQQCAAGDAAAAALYMEYVERHGTSQAADQPSCFIVLPERLSKEEWEAKYMPKDDPPGQPDDVD